MKKAAAYKDLCMAILKVIENDSTYTRLMGGNDDPTIDDGSNLLCLLSVIHDELKLILTGENNFKDRIE